jgi:hypothetical protein
LVALKVCGFEQLSDYLKKIKSTLRFWAIRPSLLRA